MVTSVQFFHNRAIFLILHEKINKSQAYQFETSWFWYKNRNFLVMSNQIWLFFEISAQTKNIFPLILLILHDFILYYVDFHITIILLLHVWLVVGKISFLRFLNTFTVENRCGSYFEWIFLKRIEIMITFHAKNSTLTHNL